MKRLPIILLTMSASVLAVIFASHAPPSAATGALCDPGPHWVDTCDLSGSELSVSTESTISLDLNFDGVADLTVNLAGKAGQAKATPSNTDPNDIFHLNHIENEVVSLTESGGGLVVIAGSDLGLPSSLGGITEQPGDSALADSFFDIFFEIQGTPFGPLRNQQPLHLEAVIDRIFPFGTIYTAPSLLVSPLVVFDVDDIPRAQFTAVAHKLVPPVPVGGTTHLLVGGSDAPAVTSDGSGGPFTYAAVAAAGALVLAAGGWYARRRWIA